MDKMKRREVETTIRGIKFVISYAVAENGEWDLRSVKEEGWANMWDVLDSNTQEEIEMAVDYDMADNWKKGGFDDEDCDDVDD
jgi:hypothetical protein